MTYSTPGGGASATAGENSALFLKRLRVELPIVQAPMAGVSTPALAAAVSNAGALGSIAVGAVDVARARAMIEAVQGRTSGPFNVNVFCHEPASRHPDREGAWLAAMTPVFERYDAKPPSTLREIYTSFVVDAAMMELFEELKPPVVSFHFGLPPAEFIARLRAVGIVLFSTATSLVEAQRALDAGVDAIVAQGIEAGGHRGVFDPGAVDSGMGTLALTRLLVGKMGLPVIAAGGIMDGAGIAAALDAGALAAQLGTAFIACPESSSDRHYREALFGPGAAMTEMTNVISGRPARSLQSRFTALAKAELKGLEPPDYPVAYDAGKALAAAAGGMGEGGFGAHWAGQGAPLARAMPAGDLVLALRDELAAIARPALIC
jgi:nitronate monooxygenase